MTLKNIATKQIKLENFISEIPKGNSVMLAQAITLVESNLPEDIITANKLVESLLPFTGKSVRMGITGVPGVGKSTFIETFGKHLTSLSKKIAVLAVDPSSTKTKGSILGDKTRMEELSKDAFAFIRPTATRSALGGVADRTREAILLCEAAGFEIIIIETVGVGQSETTVRNLVDFFMLLMLAGAGDELQGIKKGIMEMADGIVITKADGNNTKNANQARADFEYALHLFSESDSGWKPKVITSSALEKKGITETWSLIEQYVAFTKTSGYFEKNRTQQNLVWFHEHMNQLLQQKLVQDTDLNSKIKNFEKEIADKKILPSHAAQQIIQDFLKR
jgi:LAO/AO transport system kinase